MSEVLTLTHTNHKIELPQAVAILGGKDGSNPVYVQTMAPGSGNNMSIVEDHLHISLAIREHDLGHLNEIVDPRLRNEVRVQFRRGNISARMAVIASLYAGDIRDRSSIYVYYTEPFKEIESLVALNDTCVSGAINKNELENRLRRALYNRFAG